MSYVFLDSTKNPMLHAVVLELASCISTCSKYMYNFFSSCDFGYVYQGNGVPLRIRGIGYIMIKTEDGGNMLHKNVRYVPKVQEI
jgi:hypothetical protein